MPGGEHESIAVGPVRRRRIVSKGAAPEDEDPTGWKAIDRVIGCITEEIEGDDVALHPDSYVYRRDS